MPLSADEKNQIRENRFHLDLLDMALVRRGHPDDAYRGSGFIRQSAKGKLEFRIYDRQRRPSLNTPVFRLSAGASIPDDYYYDLEAHDLRGRTWRATQTVPREDGTFDEDGCICKGTAWQITCIEEMDEPFSKDALWMYLPGEIKLPTSAGTRVARESPRDQSYSFELNLWEIETERFEFVLTKVENGLEVNAGAIEGSFPEHFDMRLEEVLWFTLAAPVKWSLLEEFKGSERRFTIRALRDSPIRPRLRAPLEPGPGQPATHLGEMFTRYLERIVPLTEHQYHPVSVAIYRNLRASALSLDSEALWIPVSIETVVKQWFQHLGNPDQTSLNNLEEAIQYIEKWTGEPSLKGRVVNAIKGWRGQNAREALNQLVRLEVISDEQLSAWNQIRHRMAHGGQLTDLLEELSRLCDLNYMALLRLLFEAIGYSGPYTDRPTVGWPTVEYSVTGRNDEANADT